MVKSNRPSKNRKKQKQKTSVSTGLIVGLLTGGVLAVVLVLSLFFFLKQDKPSESQSPVAQRRISREQIKFTSDSDLAQSRTTAEWLALLKEMRTSDNKMRATMLKIRMPNPGNFLGPDPAAVPDVYEALKDPHLESYAQAIIAKFDQSTDPPYFQDVVDGLKSDHPKVRRAAIQLLALVKPEGPETVQQVGAFMNDADSEVARSATIALGAMGEPGFERLSAKLKGHDSPSPELLKGIALLGGTAAPAVPDLAKLLAVESTQLRSLVLIALEKIGENSKVALPELIEIWASESHEEWGEQIAAVMNRIGKPATTAMLEKFTQVPPEAQIIATQNFSSQKYQEAVPVLIESIKAPKSAASWQVVLDALREMLPEYSGSDEQLATVFEFGDTNLRLWTLEEIAASTELVIKYKTLLTQVRSQLTTSKSDPQTKNLNSENEARSQLENRIDQVIKSL